MPSLYESALNENEARTLAQKVAKSLTGPKKGSGNEKQTWKAKARGNKIELEVTGPDYKQKLGPYVLTVTGETCKIVDVKTGWSTECDADDDEIEDEILDMAWGVIS